MNGIFAKLLCFILVFVQATNAMQPTSPASALTFEEIKLRSISTDRIKLRVENFEKSLKQARICKRSLVALGLLVVAGGVTKFCFDMNKKKEVVAASKDGKEIDESLKQKALIELRTTYMKNKIDKQRDGLFGVAKESFMRGVNVSFYSFVGVTLYNIFSAMWSGTGNKITEFCKLSEGHLQDVTNKKLKSSLDNFGRALGEITKGESLDKLFLTADIVADHAMLVDELEKLLAVVKIVSNGLDDEDYAELLSGLRIQTNHLIRLVTELGVQLETFLNTDSKNISTGDAGEKLNKILNLYKHLGLSLIRIFEILKDAREAA